MRRHKERTASVGRRTLLTDKSRFSRHLLRGFYEFFVNKQKANGSHRPSPWCRAHGWTRPAVASQLRRPYKDGANKSSLPPMQTLCLLREVAFAKQMTKGARVSNDLHQPSPRCRPYDGTDAPLFRLYAPYEGTVPLWSSLSNADALAGLLQSNPRRSGGDYEVVGISKQV